MMVRLASASGTVELAVVLGPLVAHATGRLAGRPCARSGRPAHGSYTSLSVCMHLNRKGRLIIDIDGGAVLSSSMELPRSEGSRCRSTCDSEVTSMHRAVKPLPLAACARPASRGTSTRQGLHYRQYSINQ